MKSLLFAFHFLVMLAGNAAAATSTVFLDLTVVFDATKSVHECREMGGGLRVEDESCGPYQTVRLGQTYAAYYSFSGLFETDDGISFQSQEHYIDNQTCRIGDQTCFSSRPGGYGLNVISLSASSAFLRPEQDNEASSLEFDFLDGTGTHYFEDDGDTWARGYFTLSNARIFGLHPTPVSEVPLPASMPFLFAGLAGLVAVRRSRQKGKP